MAKKKKNKNRDGDVNLAGQQVEQTLAKAKELSRRFGPGWDDLVKFQDRFAPEQASALNQLGAAAGVNPNNTDGFVGNIPGHIKDMVGWGMDRINPESDSYVGKRSSDVIDIIARMRSGLDGYASDELQAFRESARREIDKARATEERKMMDTAGRYGLRGAAATARAAQLGRENVAQTQTLEQDLFLKNADERNRRLQDYGSFMRGVEDDEFGRVQNARKAEYEMATGVDRDYYERGQSALKNYTDWLEKMRAGDLDVQKANADQQMNQKAGKAADLGPANLINAQQQLNYSKALSGFGGRSRGRTRSGTTSTATDPRQSMYNEAKALADQQAKAKGLEV